MREKTSFWSTLIAAWQSIMSYALGASAAIALLIYRLGSLLPGLSNSEVVAQRASSNISPIIDNPLYLPHKLVQFATQEVGGQSALTVRLASVILAACFVLLFYYTVRSWHTRRVSLLATALFASSAWFLHLARLGTSDIMLVSLLVALAYGSWLHKARKSGLAIIIGSLVVGALIYTPGFIWVIIAAMFWQAKRLIKLFNDAPVFALFGLVLVILLLAPLGMAALEQPKMLRVIAGLPTGSLSVVGSLSNLAHIPIQLVAKGPENPVMWLGSLPLLDYFTLAMAVLGSYSYFFKRRLDRTKIIAGCLLVGTVLVAIGGLDRLPILMPLIYLLAAGGIALMLQRWFTVFPRNPLARNLSVSLMALAVLAGAYYNLSHYFVAWPQSPKTKVVFQNRL